MRDETAHEFTAALSQVFEGAVRLADVGVDLQVPETLGLSAAEWIERRIAGPIQLGRDERRLVVAANPDKTTRELGDALGVGHATIARDRAVSNETDDEPDTPPQQAVAVSNETDELHDVVDELHEQHGERITPDKLRASVEQTIAFDDTLGALKGSTSVEWYTPAKYVDAARRVLGMIDLDPASSQLANRTVRARRFYSETDDGLRQPWAGRVWLNPPYGLGTGDFVRKLIDEFNADRVDAAVLLINAYGFDASWFQPLWDHTLCFTDHRIMFTSPQRETGGPANGNLFAYLGDQRERFAQIFSQYGAIVERCHV